MRLRLLLTAALGLGLMTAAQDARAAIIYGIEDSNNFLVSINTTTATTSNIVDLDGALSSGSFGSNSPNGLAFDGRDTFYFTAFGGPGGSAGSTTLYSYTVGASPAFNTVATGLEGSIASGAFARGSYYWWDNNDGTNGSALRRINVTSPGAPQTVISTVRNTFGDIEIRSDGRLFVSNASSFSIYNDIFTTPTLFASYNSRPRVQLGLGNDGVLYGIRTDPDNRLFTINQDNGTFTNTGRDIPGSINDAAPSAIPEPATLGLLGAGLLGIGAVMRRRRFP